MRAIRCPRGAATPDAGGNTDRLQDTRSVQAQQTELDYFARRIDRLRRQLAVSERQGKVAK